MFVILAIMFFLMALASLAIAILADGLVWLIAMPIAGICVFLCLVMFQLVAHEFIEEHDEKGGG